MVRLKLLKRRQLKLLIFSFVFAVVVFSSFGVENAIASSPADSVPALKGAETYSEDWILKELNAIRIDNNPEYANRTNQERFQQAEKIREIKASNIAPIAYQETEDVSDLQLGELSDEKDGNIQIEGEETTYKDAKGGITDIRSTVGKSQIIQFAQPIKRLSITDPSLADLILLSPTQMILNGKAAGVTSLIIWDESDQPAFFELYVQNDTSDLLDAFKEVAPDEPINIKITDDGNVILSGTVSSTIVRDQINKISEAYGYKLVDVSESPIPQVVLELKVAEISRSISKNFSLLYKTGTWAFNPVVSPAGGVTPSVIESTGFLGIKNGAGNLWNGSSSSGFQAAIYNQSARFSSFLAMAQTKGLLNVLAEPKLVSTNGREAVFDAGQSVPVPTGVDQNGNLAYEYKDVGVKITFTPWISEKSQRVELKLAPEVSEIDPTVTIRQQNGTVIYGFRKRKATTTVELENGETLLIAGLIRRRDTNTITDPPFFANIPIIGKLVQQSSFEKEESELVIMVTPKIVKPGTYGEVLGTSE